MIILDFLCGLKPTGSWEVPYRRFLDYRGATCTILQREYNLFYVCEITKCSSFINCIYFKLSLICMGMWKACSILLRLVSFCHSVQSTFQKTLLHEALGLWYLAVMQILLQKPHMVNPLYICLNIYSKRRYLALHDPEICVNWEPTKGPTTFQCFINGQHLAPILEFGLSYWYLPYFFKL